jgi:hypothetical protein
LISLALDEVDAAKVRRRRVEMKRSSAAAGLPQYGRAPRGCRHAEAHDPNRGIGIASGRRRSEGSRRESTVAAFLAVGECDRESASESVVLPFARVA